MMSCNVMYVRCVQGNGSPLCSLISLSVMLCVHVCCVSVCVLCLTMCACNMMSCYCLSREDVCDVK